MLVLQAGQIGNRSTHLPQSNWGSSLILEWIKIYFWMNSFQSMSLATEPCG